MHDHSAAAAKPKAAWLMLALATSSLAPAVAAAAVPADQTASVEEVVVTASKRTERLQDAPVAASVVTAQSIKTLNVNSFQDYAGLVPNLNQAGGAGLGSGNIVMRGLNTGPQSLTNTTSVYIDEAPFTQNGGLAHGASLTPDPDLADIDQVEVLKGPQGTLYGASSLGGLIRIVPKEPSLDAQGIIGHLEARGGIAQGGDEGYAVRGSAYDAIVPGKLAVGLSGFTRRDPGFITNVGTGRDDIGQADTRGGSASVVLKPTDDLTIRGRAMLETGEQIGQAYQQNVSGTGTPLYGEREQSTAFDEGIKLRYELYELVAEYASPLGKFVGAYSHTVNHNIQDSDFTPFYGVLFNLYYPIITGGPPPPGVSAQAKFTIESTANNFEVRFASRRFGPLEFLVGAFHTEQSNLVLESLKGISAAGTPLPAPFYNLATLNIPTFYRETAVFGNLTFYLTDRLDFTGGLRRTGDQEGGYAQGTGLALGGALFDPAAAKDNKTLYQVNLRWRPTDTLSFYARTATGYRPGGPQTNPAAPNPTYEPDTVTDYEVGAKGSLLDRRLSFDASIYFMDWKNLQLNSVLGGILFVGNAGGAHIKGTELQLNYAASQNFSLGGSVGYNDAVLTEVAGSTAAAIGANPGDRLPASPRLTLAAYGDYRFPISAGVSADIGATVKYQGSQISSFPGDRLNIAFETPAYATLDLRGSLHWRSYSLAASVTNVTDVNGYTGYVTNNILPLQGAPSYVYLTRPRTFMLTAAVDF